MIHPINSKQRDFLEEQTAHMKALVAKEGCALAYKVKKEGTPYYFSGDVAFLAAARALAELGPEYSISKAGEPFSGDFVIHLKGESYA